MRNSGLPFSLRQSWLLLGAITTLTTILCAELAAQEDRNAYNIRAVLVDEGPTIDGSLEDAVWQLGALVDMFIQQEPDEGSP
ncbi:MAG: hypothetical protein ABGY10_07460, partial [bacterium]